MQKILGKANYTFLISVPAAVVAEIVVEIIVVVVVPGGIPDGGNSLLVVQDPLHHDMG